MPVVLEFKTMGPLYCQRLQSPVGEIHLFADNQFLLAALWPLQLSSGRFKWLLQQSIDQATPLLDATARSFECYFRGNLPTRLPVETAFPATNFQGQVWNELLKIRFGEVRSYSSIAHAIGRPRAVRAVAQAIAANPHAILTPCHRVIGKNGKLTGFAGGLTTKTQLLSFERSQAAKINPS